LRIRRPWRDPWAGPRVIRLCRSGAKTLSLFQLRRCDVDSVSALPFIYLNVAMTADGKLAPANRHFVPFGSKRDQELLLELRAQADAVMSGARTVDLSPVKLGPGPAKYRKMRLENGLAEYNLRVIVSGAATIDPRAEIFKH